MDNRPDAALTGISSSARALLLTKLGEKLAYERAFCRLYKAYLTKRWGVLRAFPKPLRMGLWEFEEIVVTKSRHLRRLMQIVMESGGDAECIVPSEELSTVAQLGVVSVFTDPKSSLKSLAQAIRVIELVARAPGNYLIRIAYLCGEDSIASELERMQRESDERIASLTCLSQWQRLRKPEKRHLRSFRTQYSPLH